MQPSIPCPVVPWSLNPNSFLWHPLTKNSLQPHCPLPLLPLTLASRPLNRREFVYATALPEIPCSPLVLCPIVLWPLNPNISIHKLLSLLLIDVIIYYYYFLTQPLTKNSMEPSEGDQQPNIGYKDAAQTCDQKQAAADEVHGPPPVLVGSRVPQ